MFSSALKSLSSNITANYQISPAPSFTSGPWKVHDGKKKTTGHAASIFIFDRKSLDVRTSGFGPRSSASAVRKMHDEVVDRLKREANSLARLRHPSILQILEPVEENRNGGLMFATEPVTASLAGLLLEKDDQERAAGIGGRASRFVVEEADGTRRRREIEIDELEIQKGLLQIGKGLEFLHESAGLVHGNLTPEAIFVNTKSDWKISGLGFAGPPDSASQSSLPPLALSEVLYHDSRLPQSVQLDLDYSSPDFVIDSNISSSADLFSLGLIIVALYNSPHISPLQSGNNVITYKKLLNSPSTTPSQNNQFLSSRPIPKELASQVLPRLITRRPAQRMNAREFQQSHYFDNILVSTIRFLESLPTKTPSEKSQFMRGLGRVLPEFPNSVLERKVLGALLEESKDRELLPLILQNVFKIIKRLPSSRRIVPDKLLPQLKDNFLAGPAKAAPNERDSSRDAGLMVVLENVSVIAENCSGRDFKEDVLPLIQLGLESSTHSLVDAALRCLPAMLPILDFPTVKDDVFPPIASVFSKTNSLTIKIRGLEAFVILCGGSASDSLGSDDGLSGSLQESRSGKSAASTILDKFTIQEKVVPLLKAIKTKEPAVMTAALNVFRQVGQISDIEFIALEVLPILWSFSLGPLLNVQQFSSFMNLIKSLSSKIEREQTKKLQALSCPVGPGNSRHGNSSPFGTIDDINGGDGVVDAESDFECLVLGKKKVHNSGGDLSRDWNTTETSCAHPKPDNTPQFSWSSATSSPHLAMNAAGGLNVVSGQPGPNSRSITPDMYIGGFPPLEPTNKQQVSGISSFSALQPALSASRTTIGSAGSPRVTSPLGQTSWQKTQCFPLIPPPPKTNSQQVQNSPAPSVLSSLGIPLMHSSQSQQETSPGSNTFPANPGAESPSQQKQGLDKYESLL